MNDENRLAICSLFEKFRYSIPPSHPKMAGATKDVVIGAQMLMYIVDVLQDDRILDDDDENEEISSESSREEGKKSWRCIKCHCRSRRAVLRRKGPKGKSMCNRCGIDWKRKLYEFSQLLKEPFVY